MARPDSWMPFYITDWMAKTGDLTAEARGAYAELLFAYWRIGGPLPDHQEKLQRLARCTDREWKRVSLEVMSFFTLDMNGWTHNRVEEELAKATARYEAKAGAGAKGAANRWHKQRQTDGTANSTAIAMPMTTGCTTHNSHSPIGEQHPSDVVASKPARRSQISPDWMLSLKDRQHAAAKGLDPKTITAISEQFRDHHLAKGTVLANVSAAWRTWVGKHIGWNGTGPWPRNVGGGPKRDDGVRQSLTAATDRILAKAGIRPEPDEQRAGEVRANGSGWAAGIAGSEGDFGPVIDADEWERVPGATQGIEGHDQADAGDDGRPGGGDGRVSQTAHGMAGGHCAEGADDAIRLEPVVAFMGRTEGPTGTIHQAQADDADVLAIPQFLRRA